MHTIKITPNLLLKYQCTSGKFIRLPNRIEKIDSVAKSNRIESKLFCLNWNALASITSRGKNSSDLLLRALVKLHGLADFQCRLLFGVSAIVSSLMITRTLALVKVQTRYLITKR